MKILLYGLILALVPILHFVVTKAETQHPEQKDLIKKFDNIFFIMWLILFIVFSVLYRQ